MDRCVASLLALAVAGPDACGPPNRVDAPAPMAEDIAEVLVEGRFAHDLVDHPCDLLAPATVSGLAEVEEAALLRYELPATCAYVWGRDEQAAVRNLVISDTIEEAESRHRASRALDDCDSIDVRGGEACIRTGLEAGPAGPEHEAIHSTSVVVRISNARFSVVWVGSEPLLDRLRAVELTRHVVASLPSDDEDALEPATSETTDAESVMDEPATQTSVAHARTLQESARPDGH